MNNSLSNSVKSILLSNSTGVGETASLAEKWGINDNNEIVTPFGIYAITPEVQTAKFIHLLSNECRKQSEEKSIEFLESLQDGYLGAFHKKAANKDTSPIIASNDTMSAEEYRTKNLELIEKELEKVSTNIEILASSGYITETEKDKIIKKVNKSVNDRFEERFGDVYEEKVKKELEFKDLIESYTGYGLKDISFKKTLHDTTEVIVMNGNVSLLDVTALMTHTKTDNFKLIKQSVDFESGLAAVVFEKTTSI